MNHKYTSIIILFVLLFSILAINVQAETFGDTTHSGGYGESIRRYYHGTAFTMGAEDGMADSITVYLTEMNNNIIRCGIYTGSMGSAITRHAQTECKTVSSDGWTTFNFTGDVSLSASTSYNLVVISHNAPAGAVGCDSGGNGVYEYYDAGWTSCKDMLSPVTLSSPLAGYSVQIYCTYTVGGANDPPTQNNHTVWDGTVEKNLNATGVAIPPTCFNVTVNDTDGDLMNVSVFTNASGSWELLNETSSGMSNGTFHVTNTSFVDSYSTTYFLAFNVSDNDDYVNETYHFTTLTNDAPVQSDHKLWCESCNDEFIFSDSDISKWITSINVTVNDSDGDYMNITILSNVSGSWEIVNETSSGMLNGTYSAFNTSWIANYSTTYFVSFNVTDGKTWTNETYNFTTKTYIGEGCDCDEIQAMLDELLDQIADLEGDNVIEIESTQFILFIQLILFCIFLWMGYSIPAMEGSKKSIHYMPFSGGLFVLFGGIDFISFALLLNSAYSIGYISGFLTVTGIIIMVYGGIKAFYYSED